MMARVTTGNPSSHLAHSPAIITNRFITRSALWLSRHLYSPPPSQRLRKCLDVKFKQHKCLPAKQSSSESCGTQSSLLGGGGEGWCGRELWSWSWGFFFSQAIQPLHKEAESPGSCIVLLKHIQFMGGTAFQVNISGSTPLPLTDLQHLGALQPPFKIDLYFLLLPFNLFAFTSMSSPSATPHIT